MKKIIITIISILLITILSVSFVSCADKNQEVTDNFDWSDLETPNASNEVKGVSAFEIVSTAYYAWKNNEIGNYCRVEEIDFNAGSVATQKAQQIYKKDGDKTYVTKVTYCTGLAGKSNIQRFLLTPEGAYDCFYENNKNVAMNGSEFVVKDWKTLEKMEGEDAIAQKTKDTFKMLTNYDLSNKDYLIDNGDKVYTYSQNNNYVVCQIKVVCDDTAMAGVQKAAADEFYSALGCEDDSLHMEEVTINFILEKYNNSYRVKGWRSFEKYTAVRIVKTNGQQYYTAAFSYDEASYKIDPATLL